MSIYAVRNDVGEWLVGSEIKGGSHFSSRGGILYSDADVARRVSQDYDGHVVELFEKTEPVVVSEDEASMLEEMKEDNSRFFGRITAFITSKGPISEDEGIWEDRLVRAYVNGYTIEKQKRFNVKVPHAENSYYYDMGWGDGLKTQDMKRGEKPTLGFREAQFTQRQIDEKGLGDCERIEVAEHE